MNFSKGEIIAIDKPYGMSSFAALARVRYLISRRIGVKRVKVGHAGTLDPLATGVLVLCTGRATKQIEQLQGHDKEYVATLQLGSTTPSYDLEHSVDATFPTSHINRNTIEETLCHFEGDIMQVPPAYSACKINGERSYILKRKGREVELAAKPIHISSIAIEDFDESKMQLRLRINCGKGTYIRALARDLGEALGSGAHLIQLRRTRVGATRVEDCLSLKDMEQWLEQQDIENTAN